MSPSGSVFKLPRGIYAAPGRRVLHGGCRKTKACKTPESALSRFGQPRKGPRPVLGEWGHRRKSVRPAAHGAAANRGMRTTPGRALGGTSQAPAPPQRRKRRVLRRSVGGFRSRALRASRVSLRPQLPRGVDAWGRMAGANLPPYPRSLRAPGALFRLVLQSRARGTGETVQGSEYRSSGRRNDRADRGVRRARTGGVGTADQESLRGRSPGVPQVPGADAGHCAGATMPPLRRRRRSVISMRSSASSRWSSRPGVPPQRWEHLYGCWRRV